MIEKKIDIIAIVKKRVSNRSYFHTIFKHTVRLSRVRHEKVMKTKGIEKQLDCFFCCDNVVLPLLALIYHIFLRRLSSKKNSLGILKYLKDVDTFEGSFVN